ncbi:MAG: membrane protein insertion efficiency factor YidD [Actinomycetales bacterium]
MSDRSSDVRTARHPLVRLWEGSAGWILGAVLVVLVRGYQLLLSPLLPPSCRFHPSCSAYALESIRVHGAVKGVILGGWRLGRCNPWNHGGVDPVPARGSWRSDILPWQRRADSEGAHVHP